MEAKIVKSKNIIDNVLAQNHIQEVSIFFNGGKDCTVLLDILSEFKVKPLIAVYIKPPNSFKEIDDFVLLTSHRYDLSLCIIEGSLKEGLEQFKSEHPKVKCVFVGTRKADNSNLEECQMTDSDWPSFLRVHPLMDWTFNDIWKYLLEKEVPYCSLYDLGYTSIGTTDDTLPNPALKSNGGYLPAYNLTDEAVERLGRL